VDIIAPEEHFNAPANAKRLLADGHATWEGRFAAEDGRRIPVEVNARVFNLDSSQTIISSVRDISERKQADKRHQEIFDGALEGIYRSSTEKGFIAANPAMARMLGYDSAQELVSTSTNTTVQLWLDPNDRERLVALLEEHGTARDFECQFKRKDGTAIWVSINCRRVCGGKGETLCYDGFVNDISERKRMEETLRKAEEKFSRAFQSSPAALTIADLATGSYLEVNGTFEQITGYRRDEVIGRRRDEVGLWADSPNRDEAVRRLVKDGSLRNWEFGFRKKSGEAGTGLLSAELIEIDGNPCAITATIDITERLQLKNQLRQAQKLESVGRLAGGVAHDFNNLLTVINGYSDFLLKRLKPPDPLRSYANEIREAGERAASLTKQLLAFSRKQIIEPRVLDLNTTIRQSAPMLQRLIGEDLVLKIDLLDGLGQVLADPDQVHQVLMNLVVNARDAMPDGGRLDIETTNIDLSGKSIAAFHDGASPGHYVLMTVTDTGHGMDETIRLQVFEPFFTTKEVGKGTGLGLSTAYGIIRQSGGWIDVSSEVGIGTSFKVYLPRIDASAVPEEIRIGVPTGGGSETVLLAEDQEAVRSLARIALTEFGYKVIEASDGDGAMSLAGAYAGEIHLLLTDVVMPGMDGRELSERLKKLRPTLKVLFMSGYTADVIAERGVIERGVAFLHKPFGPEELAQKVREVLDASPLPNLEM
jgi:PAS domain S-box-containing protein